MSKKFNIHNPKKLETIFNTQKTEWDMEYVGITDDEYVFYLKRSIPIWADIKIRIPNETQLTYNPHTFIPVNRVRLIIKQLTNFNEVTKRMDLWHFKDVKLVVKEIVETITQFQ